MAPTEPQFDSTEHAERLEAYIRPYVIALLRITIACYEREKRDERLEHAMRWGDERDQAESVAQRLMDAQRPA